VPAADPFNRGHVADLVEWLDRHAPAACFGSAEKVHAWLAGDASPAPTAPTPMEFALFLQRFATFATGTSSALARSMDQLDTIIVNQGKSMALQDDILAETQRNTALTTQMLTSVAALHDENKSLHDQLAAAVPPDNTAAQAALAALKANDDKIDAALNPAPENIPAAAVASRRELTTRRGRGTAPLSRLRP
jgi:hypothetical protein